MFAISLASQWIWKRGKNVTCITRDRKASLCDRENGERLRDSIGDLLKFTLESHVNQTLEFNLGLSKEFCIDLLEEDPNDMSCHVTVQQRVMKNRIKKFSVFFFSIIWLKIWFLCINNWMDCRFFWWGRSISFV